MGHKVHPYGFRIGIIKPWLAKWYADRDYATLLQEDMVTGVTSGFTKNLEISGVGYRAQLQGAKLVLALGYSHPVEVDPPSGIEFRVETPTRLGVFGADKELVGQIAAYIRSQRKPEPYKGKGIRYVGEVVRRKAGKTFGS